MVEKHLIGIAELFSYQTHLTDLVGKRVFFDRPTNFARKETIPATGVFVDVDSILNLQSVDRHRRMWTTQLCYVNRNVEMNRRMFRSKIENFCNIRLAPPISFDHPEKQWWDVPEQEESQPTPSRQEVQPRSPSLQTYTAAFGEASIAIPSGLSETALNEAVSDSLVYVSSPQSIGNITGFTGGTSW